jgi:hypothetical protein
MSPTAATDPAAAPAALRPPLPWPQPLERTRAAVGERVGVGADFHALEFDGCAAFQPPPAGSAPRGPTASGYAVEGLFTDQARLQMYEVADANVVLPEEYGGYWN